MEYFQSDMIYWPQKIAIEAFPYDCRDKTNGPIWYKEAFHAHRSADQSTIYGDPEDDQRIMIWSGETIHSAGPGDWIIRGVGGRIYSVSDHEFKYLYEKENT